MGQQRSVKVSRTGGTIIPLVINLLLSWSSAGYSGCLFHNLAVISAWSREETCSATISDPLSPSFSRCTNRPREAMEFIPIHTVPKRHGQDSNTSHRNSKFGTLSTATTLLLGEAAHKKTRVDMPTGICSFWRNLALTLPTVGL